MSSVTAVDTAPSSTPGPGPRQHRWRLAFGVIARVWLWFLVGCLLVTFVPMLFGWRPYIIESGSMEPRIKVGDVVLASPEQDPQKLLGRVTTFDDPDRLRASQDPPRDQDQRRRHAADQGRCQPDAGQRRGLPRPGARHRPAARALGGPAADLVHTGPWLKLRSSCRACCSPALPSPTTKRTRRRRTTRPGAAGRPAASWSEPRQRIGDDADTGRRDEAVQARGPLERRVLTPFTARLAIRIGFVALACGCAAAADDHRRVRRDDQQRLRVVDRAELGLHHAANLLGPYLYWKLDDETGATVASQTAADASGNGRTGQYNGNLVPNVSATYFTAASPVR